MKGGFILKLTEVWYFLFIAVSFLSQQCSIASDLFQPPAMGRGKLHSISTHFSSPLKGQNYELKHQLLY